MHNSSDEIRPAVSKSSGMPLVLGLVVAGLLAAGLWLGREPLTKALRTPGDSTMPSSTTSRTEHAASRIEHANDASFTQVVLNSSTPVLVDFYADWCSPCRALAPVLEDLAGELQGAKIVKVNVDHSQQTAVKYGIQSIPSLLVFRDGKVVARHVGMASKDRLKSLLF